MLFPLDYAILRLTSCDRLLDLSKVGEYIHKENKLS